jgi:AAA-like domain
VITPRFPLRAAHQNVLVGSGGEAAALYRLRTVSYRFLAVSGKWRLQGQLERLASTLAADFSLWRVCRGYPADGYLAASQGLLDEQHGHPVRWQHLLAGHQQRMRELAWYVPEVYLAVSLRSRKQPVGLGAGLIRSSDRAGAGVRGALGLHRREAISARRLGELAAAEQRTLERLSTLVMGVRRARTIELQWLIARAACRGIAEPALDVNWRPQALRIETQDGKGGWEPLEQVLYRPANAPVREHKRHLLIESEQGDCHQALLTVGGLPDAPMFPGAAAELMFAPLEGCGFPVDAVLHARWVGNRLALSQVRKRIADVDHAYSEQLAGAAHGPSIMAGEDRVLAREYEAQLESGGRPGMLYATVSLALGAGDEAELERRVDVLREQYGDTLLHRPAGLQAALWAEHLPRADGGQVGDYRQQVTVEQFGAMIATGTHAVGSARGVYLGFTASGVARPVRYDPTAASRENRASTVLLAGSLGSGKSVAAQLIAHAAAIRGSRVIDIDPKPDHGLDGAPGLEGLVEVLELSGAAGQQGRLDPLRIGIEDLREELAVSYLLELLRDTPPSWENAIGRAVKQAVQQGQRSSMSVIRRLLEAEDPAARDAGQALEVVCDLGLARLGFTTESCADEDQQREAAGVLCIRTPGLVLPDPQAARETYTRQERISAATLSLLAAYVIRLISTDRHVHKLVLLDEAHSFLATRQGRAVVTRLVKMGRACNATVLIATQLIGDLGELVDLVGTWLIFGQDSDSQAALALERLGLDGQDAGLVELLREARTGHGLMRDLHGRVGEIQTDADPSLLAALATTPPTGGQQ